MSNAVFDSSAVLAIICGEPDTDSIIDACSSALLSATNLAEVYSKSADVGITIEEMQWAIRSLQLTIVSCDEEHAELTGVFREPTRRFGLSLGDRACLALGKLRGLPVVTADQNWREVNVGVDVLVFRNQKHS